MSSESSTFRHRLPDLRRVLPWALWGVAVVIVLSQRHEIARTTISPGIVEATVIDLRASHDGRIVALNAKVGDSVGGDDVVIAVGSPELDSEIAIARAEAVALQSAVLATGLDVQDADRELFARLGQDLERATVDVAQFQRELDEARAERAAVTTQLERFDALIAKGLATNDDKAELETSRQVLAERETTTTSLIAIAKGHEQRARKRVDELLTARKPTKHDDDTDVEEARVAAARAEATAKDAEVAALEAVRTSLSMTAGTSATVTDVFVSPGAPVIAGDFLVRVVKTGTPRVTAWFDEANARGIKVNDRVVLTPSDGASRRRRGRIVSLAGAIAEVPLRFRLVPNQPLFARAAIIEIEGEAHDGDAPLLPGMALDVRVEGP